MDNIFKFLRKTYKVFLFFVLVIAFFVTYDTFLVDRSAVNLRVALNKAAEAQTVEEFESIKALLRAPILAEISKSDTSSRMLVSMELAEGLTSAHGKDEQKKEIKFYLETVSKDYEKKRGGFLSALDRVNASFFRSGVSLSNERLEARARDILARIGSITDKQALQQAYYDLGNAYIQSYELVKAEEAFSQAIKIAPDTKIATKAKFNIAWAYKNTGDYAKSIASFDSLAKENESSELGIASRYQIAGALYRSSDFEKSRDEYAGIASKYSGEETIDIALFQAGLISFYELNDIEAASKYFNQIEEKFSNTRLAEHVRDSTLPGVTVDLRAAGYVFLVDRQYDDAVGSFKKAVAIAPSDGSSLGGLAVSFYLMHNREGALTEARKALKPSLKMGDDIGITNSFYVFLKSGNINEAIKIKSEVLSKTQVTAAEFYYNLGTTYLSKRRYDDAVSQLNHSVKLNPNFTAAYNNLGSAYWLSKRYTKAIDQFLRALSVDPEYLPARYNLGVAYFYLNRLADSYREFKAVSDKNPRYRKTKDFLQKIEEGLDYKSE